MFIETAKAAIARLTRLFKRTDDSAAEYQARIEAEKNTYDNCLAVHELPDIFHYWSNRYLRPKLEAFGFSSPYDFFDKYLEDQCRRKPEAPKRFISIGSGNCDMEVAAARTLRNKGFTNFTFECLELNPTMLKRGEALAAEQQVTDNVSFVSGDFNKWRSRRNRYDVVIANQSLHHVLNLEHLLSSIKKALTPDGRFLISDMIGRNGHMRWPEALEIVNEFWNQLPPWYQYNYQLRRNVTVYENWDCSQEGFEGIRAQDILPLLTNLFPFELFIAFGNVIDPFIDRGFGLNFDPSRDWDRAFIDKVHERDECELIRGKVKPTHMIAVARKKAYSEKLKHHEPLTPQFCIRRPPPV